MSHGKYSIEYRLQNNRLSIIHTAINPLLHTCANCHRIYDKSLETQCFVCGLYICNSCFLYGYIILKTTNNKFTLSKNHFFKASQTHKIGYLSITNGSCKEMFIETCKIGYLCTTNGSCKEKFIETHNLIGDIFGIYS